MKFTRTLLPIFLALTTACQPVFAAYFIPDNAVTTAKIKDANVTRAKLATGAKSKELYVTASSNHSLDTALTDILEMTCSAACTITLPTAVGIQGYQVTIVHNGTQLVPITLHTTSSQTVGGVADNSYKMHTIGERTTIYSDNVNWKVRSHEAATDWISAGAAVNFVTLTVSSAAATLAAVYVPAFVFTVSSANATVASTYTNSGVTCTTAATIASQTTLVMTCPSATAASGTLTKASGVGDATITFSAVAGNTSGTSSMIVAKTIAAQTTLITSATTIAMNASGRIVKTSGTGDAVITYSAFSGAADTFSATTTKPTWYGDPLTNLYKWKRSGRDVIFWWRWYQTSAGVIGSGDYIFPTVSGISIDTGVIAAFSTGSGQISATSLSLDSIWPPPASGMGSINASTTFVMSFAIPHSATAYRVYGLSALTTAAAPLGSSFITASNSAMQYNFMVTFPALNWQP